MRDGKYLEQWAAVSFPRRNVLMELGVRKRGQGILKFPQILLLGSILRLQY
jgi:hypothetical protein